MIDDINFGYVTLDMTRLGLFDIHVVKTNYDISLQN